MLAVLLAAGTLLAAKPLPPAEGPADATAQARASFRGQGISACVAELRAVPDLGPEDLESICGCAVDRFLQRAGARPMPAVDPQTLQRGLRGPMISCTARIRPERMSDVARLNMPAPVAPPLVTEAPPADGKPIDAGETPAEAESGSESSSGGFWAWLSNLGWPAWLSGASVLWWIAIGIFVFGLLILKFRGRDPRKDLSAPPSHMRKGAPPQPPRRPDLPR